MQHVFLTGMVTEVLQFRLLTISGVSPKPQSGLQAKHPLCYHVSGFNYWRSKRVHERPIVKFGAALLNQHRQIIRKSTKMAVPKSKITKSKRNMRRAHDSLSADAYVEDKVTGELHRPHHIDLKTGMYRGKQVVKVKERI
jgi:large subunit ribosomal protein L32